MFGLDFSSKQKLALFAIIGIAAIGLSIAFARNSGGSMGGGVTLRDGVVNGDSGVITTDSDSVGGASDANVQVVVQVAGAVQTPGVYTLAKSKRVLDAVNAAGGALPDADLQSINLAEKLIDGSRICVPSKLQTQPSSSQDYAAPQSYSQPTSQSSTYSTSSESPSKKGSSSNKFKNPGDGVVSINSASVDQLQCLPGVGPSTAEKIIAYRAQIGAFSRPEQIMDVKGIGPKKYEKMRPFLRL